MTASNLALPDDTLELIKDRPKRQLANACPPYGPGRRCTLAKCDRDREPDEQGADGDWLSGLMPTGMMPGMGRQLIRTDRAPGSSLYSQGVRVGDHVYVSGMTGTDPATGALAGGTIQEQTRQAIANCLTILEAGGAGYDDIAEVGVLLTNPADFAGLNEEYARAFPTDPPARYVAKLGVELPGVLVSIRMTAITS